MPRSLANGLLILTAMVWGSVFIAQEWAAQAIGPFSFNGVRFFIGAALLAPVAYWEYRKKPIRFDQLGSSGLLLLLGLGLSLGLGSAAQQIGIGLTTTAKALGVARSTLRRRLMEAGEWTPGAPLIAA